MGTRVPLVRNANSRAFAGVPCFPQTGRNVTWSCLLRRTLALAALIAGFLVLSAAPITTPHASAASPLTWTACDGGFECATLKVPLDYSNAGGQQIDLG